MPDGATVADVLHKLGIPRADVRICFVNGLYREPNYPLHHQDELALFPPIGGGCGDSRRRSKIEYAIHPHILDTQHPPEACDIWGD